jgi:hypothetical protein
MAFRRTRFVVSLLLAAAAHFGLLVILSSPALPAWVTWPLIIVAVAGEWALADLTGYDGTGPMVAVLLTCNSAFYGLVVAWIIDRVSFRRHRARLFLGFHRAARRGKVGRVRHLFEDHPELREFRSLFGTPLESVICGHHQNDVPHRRGLVRTMLEAGARADGSSGHPAITTLQSAARDGDLAIVRMLLEHGADVRRRNARGDTALGYAVQHGHLEIVQVLVEAGADVLRDGERHAARLRGGQAGDRGFPARAWGEGRAGAGLTPAPPKIASPEGRGSGPLSRRERLWSPLPKGEALVPSPFGSGLG